MLAMEPCDFLHASSISAPRFATSFSPSAKEKYPAAANAAYSPRLRPAAATGAGASGKRSRNAARHAIDIV